MRTTSATDLFALPSLPSKGNSVRSAFLGLAIGLSALACSSSSNNPGGGATGGDAAAFVGSWTCSVEAGSATAPSTELLTITESSSTSITVSYDPGPGFTCPGSFDTWTVSGSVATAPANSVCNTGQSAITINSFTLTVDGTSLTFDQATTTGGASTTYTGTCKQQ